MRLLFCLAILLVATPAAAGAVRFLESQPMAFDFIDVPAVPADFGAGEFSFELWIKPDHNYPTGPTPRGAYSQLRNWSEADPEPYSSDGWWLAGNWLLDGHTRPKGFGPGDTREGTFSLQFHGGGRLRWMFADSGADMPRGMVYAVQAWPATTTPSLLDGRWHHVVAVRRWRAPAGARLELWIDGRKIGATDIPRRTDMRVFWKQLAHPDDPPDLGGWSFGAEVMTAWNRFFTQYEDYKGLLDDVRFWGRALSPAEIDALAAGREADPRGALAWFRFEDGRDEWMKDALGSGLQLELRRAGSKSWSDENRPRAK